MREHKYKAYHKEHNIIADVLTISFTTKSVTVLVGGRMRWQFEDIELMEYIGLKDKNGTEVYTGHIIKCFPNKCPHEVIFAEAIGGTYFGGMPTFYLSGLTGDGYAWTGEEEVIGNIYQDKHLLEG